MPEITIKYILGFGCLLIWLLNLCVLSATDGQMMQNVSSAWLITARGSRNHWRTNNHAIIIVIRLGIEPTTYQSQDSHATTFISHLSHMMNSIISLNTAGFECLAYVLRATVYSFLMHWLTFVTDNKKNPTFVKYCAF